MPRSVVIAADACPNLRASSESDAHYQVPSKLKPLIRQFGVILFLRKIHNVAEKGT